MSINVSDEYMMSEIKKACRSVGLIFARKLGDKQPDGYYLKDSHTDFIVCTDLTVQQVYKWVNVGLIESYDRKTGQFNL